MTETALWINFLLQANWVTFLTKLMAEERHFTADKIVALHIKMCKADLSKSLHDCIAFAPLLLSIMENVGLLAYLNIGFCIISRCS